MTGIYQDGTSSYFAIYPYGEIVMSVPPEPSVDYYVMWTPSYISSGYFYIDGISYNFSDYSSGIFNLSSSVLSGNFGWPIANSTIKTISTNVLSVGSFTFHQCYALSQVSLPDCKYIDSAAFYRCSSLVQFSLPACSYIGDRAFGACIGLKQMSLPVCEYISFQAFVECSRLSQLNLPACEYIGENAFWKCSNISQVSLPACKYIDDTAFAQCMYYLSQVSLPVCSYLGAGVFNGCSRLKTITLGYSSVCEIDGSYVFQSTLIASGTGSIYVPSSLVSAYKSAQWWSSCSSWIYPINN